MRAAIVSVDYDDILEITLPWNRHHFEEVLVVTTPKSRDGEIAERFGAKVFRTNAFYDDGAHFNKWKAFEAGLDAFGRHGVLAIMDADVLWPTRINHPQYERGRLYSPYRYLWLDVNEKVPGENVWPSLPLFQDEELAGYTQIFHADDPHLPPAPWHQTDWIHAGGADSFFQQLWPMSCKVRPSWRVLHIGVPGRNWCGRATPRTDGKTVEEAANRRERLGQLLNQRYINQRRTGNPYAAERLGTRSSSGGSPGR